MIHQAKLLREWFDIFASAMSSNSKPELAINDVRTYFANSGEPLDGVPYDPSNRTQSVHLTDTLGRLAQLYSKYRLLAVRRDLERFTPRLGLHVPENVLSLSPRGRWLSSRPIWQRTTFFVMARIVDIALEILKRFRVALVTVSVVFGVLKFALQWDSYMAIMATLTAAIAAIFATIFAR